MLLLQTGQKTLSALSARPPSPGSCAKRREFVADNEPCEDLQERETQHDLKIKVKQMRDKYDARILNNIKRSELCLSMLILSGEWCV